MQQLNILNTREVKKIREQVIGQFGFFPKEDYAYLRNENNRIFLVNKDIARIELKKLKIDKIGLYFAEIMKNEEVRLSKEGAQIIGKGAKSNVIELNEGEIKEYFQGSDLDKDLGNDNKLVLLRYKDDIIGCAKYKEGKILNFLPKINRGTVIV
jgi:NOL1/NOP2/fmu family ribosome biogenesis protein